MINSTTMTEHFVVGAATSPHKRFWDAGTNTSPMALPNSRRDDTGFTDTAFAERPADPSLRINVQNNIQRAPFDLEHVKSLVQQLMPLVASLGVAKACEGNSANAIEDEATPGVAIEDVSSPTDTHAKVPACNGQKSNRHEPSAKEDSPAQRTREDCPALRTRTACQATKAAGETT
eukprot:Selendium_serpulae@DN7325_c0_g1_i1.p1